MTLAHWGYLSMFGDIFVRSREVGSGLGEVTGAGKVLTVCPAERAFILSREVAMAGIRVGRGLVVETTLMRAIWGAGAMGEEKRQEINSLRHLVG